MLQHQIPADEHLRWTGRPDPGRAAKRRFPLFFAGLATVLLSLIADGRLMPQHFFRLRDWHSVAALHHGSAGAAVYLSLSAGMVLLLVPFLAYRRALNTEYAVTDRRLLSVDRGWFGQRRRSARLVSLDQPVLRMHADGSGDILLPLREQGMLRGRETLQGFVGVRNARRVHDLIVRLWTDEHAKSARLAVGPDYIELLLQGKRIVECEAFDEMRP